MNIFLTSLYNQRNYNSSRKCRYSYKSKLVKKPNRGRLVNYGLPNIIENSSNNRYLSLVHITTDTTRFSPRPLDGAGERSLTPDRWRHTSHVHYSLYPPLGLKFGSRAGNRTNSRHRTVRITMRLCKHLSSVISRNVC